MAEQPTWETVTIRGTRHVIVDCGECGVVYTVPLVLHDKHWRLGGFHDCPNGHGWGWKTGHEEQEALRRERDRLKQENARLDEERVAAERRVIEEQVRTREERRKRERIEKRIGSGVCPCCNRTFSQLARHMQNKHPDVPFVSATKLDPRQLVRTQRAALKTAEPGDRG